MSDFDWPSFLQRHGIEYTNHGPSTSKGNVYVSCPFCGAADKGHHMGISLSGRGYGCWKADAHRGRNPVRLIAALLRISHAEAARIAGVSSRGLPNNPNDVLSGMLLQLTGGQKLEQPTLSFPVEFSDRWDSKAAEPFEEYLIERGFSPDELDFLVEHYQLKYALTGDFRYRVIIPIYDHTGALYSWTGRAINSDAKIRYKTLSPHEKKPPVALGPTSDILLDLPSVSQGGDFLVVVEGPFDALRLTLYAEEFEAKASCLFGKRISQAQISLLADVRLHYNDIFVILDPDAATDMLSASTSLNAIGVHVWPLPGEEDPGEMDAAAIRRLFTDLRLATGAS